MVDLGTDLNAMVYRWPLPDQGQCTAVAYTIGKGKGKGWGCLSFFFLCVGFPARAEGPHGAGGRAEKRSTLNSPPLTDGWCWAASLRGLGAKLHAVSLETLSLEVVVGVAAISVHTP